MNNLTKLFFTGLVVFSAFCFQELISATSTTSLPGNAPSKIPPVQYPSKPATPAAPATPSAPLTKPALPPAPKPFGMPGVLGVHEGKWEETDYLGHLSRNISVSIEVLKGDKSPVDVDISALQTSIDALLKNEGLNPHTEVAEGPPLPFLHVLVIIYPVDKDKFVIFSTCRLFEEIQVMRKDFKPAGYWQGITWENQDISVANLEQLPTQVKNSAETLVKAFIERYHLYNKDDMEAKEPLPKRAATPQ